VVCDSYEEMLAFANETASEHGGGSRQSLPGRRRRTLGRRP
jgi:hypothetical protein